MPTPERTTTEGVVQAGCALLEESGPTGVTMQAVAARVGVRAPSLYKRVRDRDALLQAIATEAASTLAARLASSHGDLAALAAEYRGFAHDRPEAFRLLFTPSAPEDALHRASEPVLRACESLVGAERALDAARLFTAWATGFLQMELAGSFRLGGDVDHAFEYGLQSIVRGLGGNLA